MSFSSDTSDSGHRRWLHRTDRFSRRRLAQVEKKPDHGMNSLWEEREQQVDDVFLPDSACCTGLAAGRTGAAAGKRRLSGCNTDACSKKIRVSGCEAGNENEDPAAGTSSKCGVVSSPAARPPAAAGQRRNLYVEDGQLTHTNEYYVIGFRRLNGITVRPFDVSDQQIIPKPVITGSQAFAAWPQFQSLLRPFRTLKPIQMQAWPILLQGKDMVGVAGPASGKTLAYVMPVIAHTAAAAAFRRQTGFAAGHTHSQQAPDVLILTSHVAAVRRICDLVNSVSMPSVRAYSGDTAAPVTQIHVTTAEGTMKQPQHLSHLSIIVIDEADDLLGNPAIEQQLRTMILSVKSGGRETQLVLMTRSLTLPVRHFAARFMLKPVLLIIESQEVNHSPAASFSPSNPNFHLLPLTASGKKKRKKNNKNKNPVLWDM